MSRYIDADSAKEIYLSKSAGEQLDRVPTADVQEVKHGYFLGNRAYEQFFTRWCSHCRNRTPLGNYCLICGAEMDGDRNEYNRL